ncbi:ABC transporter ATP-binding protein [Bifidobacterium pseudocatenulatum]|uniref:ABC transporter ATP-binding protein n=4 Tax=Bifidobacterium pseudocatenulatum TaxID=28026 RepID=A0A413KDE0_BIFPS|nr:ABC transporter ATP-binding protein [Bifidobacterium pseudocatenulatum]RGY77456.1 ABC transporter ATP-binding protein [Bifidobacterium pseudocatenulatum]
MLKFMRISKRMILGVVCSIAGSTLSFFVPLLIKDFIDNKKFDLSLLYVFPFLFAAQFILCAIGGLLISTEADLHVAELRIQAMDIIFEKDMLFFDNENSGEIASGIVYDISLVRNFVAASIPQFVSSVINILFSVVALTVINYRLSILVLIIFPAVMILAVPLGIFNNRNAMMLQERIGKLNTFTSEIVRSMRTVKLCNAERCMLLKFKKRVNEIKEVNLLNDKVYSFVTPVQNLISIFCTGVIVCYGVHLMDVHLLTYGSFVAYVMLFFQLVTPVGGLFTFYLSCQTIKGSLKKSTVSSDLKRSRYGKLCV